MLPRVREFYALESLWDVGPASVTRVPRGAAYVALGTGHAPARDRRGHAHACVGSQRLSMTTSRG